MSIRPTDPSGNAFDSKRKRKGDGLIDFGILGVNKYTTTLFGVRWVFITDLKLGWTIGWRTVTGKKKLPDLGLISIYLSSLRSCPLPIIPIMYFFFLSPRPPLKKKTPDRSLLSRPTCGEANLRGTFEIA